MDTEKLTKLQELVIDRLIEALSPENRDEATPGMVQAALRFLADNEIGSLPVKSERAKQLEAKVPFKNEDQ